MQDLTHPEDLPHSQELLEKLLAGGPPYEVEKRYIRKDGSVIWIHKSVSAIRDPNGTVQSLIAVLIDITKSKQAEDDLQQLNLQLENLVQSRTSQLRSANQSLREEIAERIRVEEELNLNRDRLRELSRRLVEVQEEERHAIARELHDRAGQTLSALQVNLIIINQQLLEDSKQRIGTRLNDSMKLMADVIALIRDVMSDLRPAILDEYGLQAALESYMEEFQYRYAIRVQFDQPVPSLLPLEPAVAMTVLRIVQEALTNVARHAQAKHVRISMRLVDNTIYLSVEDDGIGIPSGQRVGRPDSHGLKIMRERAEAFGGAVQIGPAPEKGTRVEASIPVGNPA
jgi:signal transduction histidine kinase